MRRWLCWLLVARSLIAADTTSTLSPQNRSVISHITADALRGHVTFLASDLLEGRDTPSRGLDIAAEYIAAQFQLMGLKPAGSDGYFQTTNVALRTPDPQDLEFVITSGGKSVQVTADQSYLIPAEPLFIEERPLIVINEQTSVNATTVRGAVVYLESTKAFGKVDGKEPALVLYPARRLPGRARVVLPDIQEPLQVPIVNADLADLLRGATDAHITLRARAAHEQLVPVRNVAGLLPGSDPQLWEQYVIVSAHYDHLGLATSGVDRIFNGANDDASGVATVLETASALAALPVHPKRSILFLTFFGEEKGMLGSQYYAAHPLKPLAQTIAQLNLEQMGRVDSNAPVKTPVTKRNSANLTGWDYSSVSRTLQAAALQVGISLSKDSKASDQYFARSDNASLAKLGIPAHTMSVTYEFPDYHEVSDEWQKIAYGNMARVNRAVALAIFRLASDATVPAWNSTYKAAKPYVDASRKLHQQPANVKRSTP